MDDANENLVARLKAGESAAFNEVFAEFSKKIYYFSFGYIKDKQGAEDIVQEAFIKLWDKRGLLDENKNISGFIFTITYHLIMDYFRKQKNERKYQESIFYQPFENTFSSEENIFYTELESLYQKAINNLPPRRKEIYLLSRHEGLTYRQIADKLQISIKTVENQIAVALSFMREYFKQTNGILLLYFFWENNIF